MKEDPPRRVCPRGAPEGTATGPSGCPTIFEKSRTGRRGTSMPPPGPGRAIEELVPENLLRRGPLGLPEVSELDAVRHYTHLSSLNAGVDSCFYPLGSCTMKYNPRLDEAAASFAGFTRVHPYQDPDEVQGTLRIMAELEDLLAAIAGLGHVSLLPAAGAHGEFTALMMIRAYQADHHPEKKVILIPDSAHGTNPASSAMAGFRPVEVRSTRRGTVDLEDLRSKLGPEVAAVMITNPNTLGLFEEEIQEISASARGQGAFTYMDGANLNALLGIARPGDFGIDILHVNLHKTFSTPHGGGGPGAGPIVCSDALEPYLPVPRIRREGNRYSLDVDRPKSIGKVRAFHGSVGVLIRAFAYIRSHGPGDLKMVSECAVLAANYIRARLRDHYDIPFDRPCMHEVVLSAVRQKKLGVRAFDIAKRLIDLGFHPPTIYFPLIVPEALMIEPTETESKETLDRFIEGMIQIADEAVASPERVREAPRSAPVRRPDEVRAIKEPRLTWQGDE